MGAPDGGWYDDDPPRVVSSTPADQATNVTAKKITILFDEYIKLADPSQNVIVSPPQLEMPEIKAAGKKIVVELKDTLKPNTTYTIDFSDAITDNNEDNPMGNFTYTFSTGEQIDTFEVAGYVLDASNLEPVKGISVGLYNNLADSVFRKEPLMRISRTDGTGRFVIKGVAPGEYRVYALQDADNDFKFTQKSEMIAFSHQTYKPYSKPDIRQDTIWRDTLHIDNILQVPYTHFFPDDVIMMAFQEVQTDRYLLKQPDRTDANRIKLFFSYGNEQLPVIKGLNFDADSAFVVEYNEKKDSLIYWLRDTTLINQDTLALSMEYLMTDSMGVLVSQTDTIDVIAKTSYAKRQKEKQKEYEKWEKEQEKKKKREEPYDSIYPIKPLEMKFSIPSSMNPTSKIRLEIPTPLEKADTSAVHLYSKVDSLWYRVPFVFRQLDSVMRQFEVVAEWQPETEYSLEIDSAAFVDIYGLASEAVKKGIKAKPLDDFASLVFRLTGVRDTGIVVQLLSKDDKCVRQVRAGADREAAFFYLDSGKYYARAFVDRNGNNLWDTGNYDEDLQPEDIYYYSGEIECKAKWDITKEWNLTAKPRNMQKPGALIKQKDTKEKKKKQNRNAERARKLGIEYIKQQAVKQEKVEK
jgi:uncharacterized protein (DUF2141 family)